jgi:putative heme iron utilization protein
VTQDRDDSATLAREARNFLAQFKTLVMATVDRSGTPEASYAPFVRAQDDCFYVYVSGLSRHTGNLTTRGVVSVLLIEDESRVNQPFARRRITFDCRAERIARESEPWHAIMALFDEKFGKVIDLIRPLKDFELFRLRPQNGIYVKGFAQAYRIDDAALKTVEHIRDATGNTKPV